MPVDATPRHKQTPILWIAILVAVPLLFLCCGGISVVTLVVSNLDRNANRCCALSGPGTLEQGGAGKTL